MGAYVHSTREVSILSDEQKNALSNLGSTISPYLGSQVEGLYGSLPANAQAVLGQLGFTSEALSNMVQPRLTNLSNVLNSQARKSWMPSGLTPVTYGLAPSW
jgi:hypothetical protein